MDATKPDEASIFALARKITDPERRRAYLDQSCQGAHGLRTRLEALLRVHDEDHSFLDAMAVEIRAAVDAPVSEGPGAQVGPYTLLEPIGEGGFGVVFLAEQLRPIRRMVALKIIKPGMDTRQVVARFESERQSLALMSHPNIAQIIDGGRTESGRPYFVMELVRGVPITEFCDENRLAAGRRLELFVTVCHAIQHAHQKGIIHRDVKPSNVMVAPCDGLPVVKVIDFGVARATERTPTEKTLCTADGQMIGTPAYMSPEQAEMSRLDIDTRSDVYSLGVLLYELLTGTTPIDSARLRTAGYGEVQRLIREEVPPRPSARLSSLGIEATALAADRGMEPRPLVRLLAGDLDWIVMKALEKDRNRRYSTPTSLAEDVERYLRRDAILARPPSATYRLTRLAQRHRAAVLAAAAVVAALLAGTAIAIWQAVVATRAKHEALAAATAERRAKQTAEAKQAETRAVLEFLEKRILAAARPRGLDGGLGPDVTLRAAIDAAVPFVEGGFKDQPLTEARLRMSLGKSFLYLDDGPAAAAQFQPTRAIYTRLLGPDHPDTIDCIIQLGLSYWKQGRTAESVKLHEEMLAISRAKFGPDDRQTLKIMNYIGIGLYEQAKYEEAMRILQEVLAIQRSKYHIDDRSTITTMTNLANVYHAIVRQDDALKLHTEAFELLRARYGPDDTGTLLAMHNLAGSLRAIGRCADALRLNEEVLSRRRALLGVDHPQTLHSLWGTAHDLIRLHRGAEAVPLLDECLRRAVGKHVHWNFKEVAALRRRYFQKAKDAEQCRTTAELWENLRRTDAESLYGAAVCRAVTAAVLDQASAPGADRVRRVKDEADRAMVWLEKAVAAGYKNVEWMKMDDDLAALRDRADFRALMATLESKSK